MPYEGPGVSHPRVFMLFRPTRNKRQIRYSFVHAVAPTKYTISPFSASSRGQRTVKASKRVAYWSSEAGAKTSSPDRRDAVSNR